MARFNFVRTWDKLNTLFQTSTDMRATVASAITTLDELLEAGEESLANLEDAEYQNEEKIDMVQERVNAVDEALDTLRDAEDDLDDEDYDVEDLRDTFNDLDPR